jgi:hypothetical protein
LLKGTTYTEAVKLRQQLAVDFDLFELLSDDGACKPTVAAAVSTGKNVFIFGRVIEAEMVRKSRLGAHVPFAGLGCPEYVFARVPR